MKASQVILKDLNSYDECSEAIEYIESDYQNTLGGLTAWNSGMQTHLTAAAEKKIAAIQKRMDEKWPDEEED